MDKKGSNSKKEPRTKIKSNWGGSSRGTSKKRSLSKRREETNINSRVTKSNEQPLPKKKRGSFS